MKKQSLISTFIVRGCAVAIIIGFFSIVRRTVDALLVPLNNQIAMQQLESSNAEYLSLVVLHEIGRNSFWLYLAIAVVFFMDPVIRLITYWRNEQ